MSRFRIYVDANRLWVINEEDLTDKFGLRNKQFDGSRPGILSTNW